MKPAAIPLALALLAAPLAGNAQFCVASGTTFYALPGTPLCFDSLTLLPTAPLALSGVALAASYTPIAGNGGSSVRRVYDFGSAVLFSGQAGFYVAAGERNGNQLPALQIAYDAGAGFTTTTSSAINIAADYVAYNFNTPTRFRKITAVNAGVVLSVSATEDPILQLSLYPNPVADILYAELSGEVPPGASLTVLDVNGRTILKTPIYQSSISLNLAALPAGMYFVRYADRVHSRSTSISKR